jgi:antitoxin (DNA-binding transcriptional repressor) of toxin-antitoxin stability system
MKTTTVERFSADPTGFLQAAQQERVLVTRGGKPLALLVGVEFKDQEDWNLEMSPAFWQMVQQRRERPTIPLRELEASLLNDDCPQDELPTDGNVSGSERESG